MKRLAIVLIGLGLVLSGCSSAFSEVSPQQKRNNFDLCVLEGLYPYPYTSEDIFRKRLKEEFECRNELK